MINSKVNATGELEIILRDSNGDIKVQKTVPNLVVTIGKTVIASRLAGTATPVMSHMSVGSVSTAPNITNTALAGEIAGSRSTLAVAGGTPAANVVTFSATFGAGVGTGSIVEAGIFNNVSGGSMLCRTTFSVVSKDVGDTLTINWAVTIN